MRLAGVLTIRVSSGKLLHGTDKRGATRKKHTCDLQAVLNTCLAFTCDDLSVTEAGGGAVITSFLLIGAAGGGFFAGQVADAIGPCRTLLWNNLPLLAGSLFGAAAPGNTVGFYFLLLGECCAAFF